MIVVEEPEAYVLITQNDHAHLAAELLELWPSFRGHPHHDAVLRSVELHDNGWREIDATPPVDALGKPHDFLTLPWNLHFEVWDGGTERYLDSDPACALLIAEHAIVLHSKTPPTQRKNDLISLVRQRRDQLIKYLGPTSSELLAAYRWLGVCDYLSLVACSRWQEPFSRPSPEGPGDLTGRLRCHRLELKPFPFVGTTTLRVAARRVSRRTYQDRVDLGTALASAPWVSLPVQVHEL